MLNKRTSGRLSPRPLARVALQIPLSGGTTRPEYLYCSAKIVHSTDISKTFNISYYVLLRMR